MGKNKTRSKSALKQNSVTAENKRLGDDGNINFTFKVYITFDKKSISITGKSK